MQLPTKAKSIDPSDRLPTGPRGLPMQVCPYRHQGHYLAGVEPAAWWVCAECHPPAGKVEWAEGEKLCIAS